MDLEQAYRILEIPITSTMLEVKRAYRDLALVWHPDRHTENERLQRKALEKMRELNAAYDCICIHFTHEEHKNEEFKATIIDCPECGTKNRVSSYRKDLVPKCGRCGTYLFLAQHTRQSKAQWEHRILCGDGGCIGILDFTGRCKECGKTYEEGVAAEKEREERRNREQEKSRSRQKNTGIYILSAILSFLIIFYVYLLYSSRTPTVNKTELESYASQGSSGASGVDGAASSSIPQANNSKAPFQLEPSHSNSVSLDAPDESEPAHPNRLRTGFVPCHGEIQSGHSELTIDNGTDTDALVIVLRFKKDSHQIVRSFYIRAYDDFTAKHIPRGEYVLRVAFGIDWNSKTSKFNFRRSFSETQRFAVDETSWTENIGGREFLRTRSSNISITLNKVPHGNFRSHPIDEDNFFESLPAKMPPRHGPGVHEHKQQASIPAGQP